jgi:hypothetical protein
MNPPKRNFPGILGLVAGLAMLNHPAAAQTTTPPANPAELEAMYAKSLENRTDDILKILALSDAAKSNTVHDIIISQYRVMRDRDGLINAQLEAVGKEINYSNRAPQLEAESKLIHEYFFARLEKSLTSEQIEKLKDKMTYNKVKVTYDAYNVIVPGLTDPEKAKILELLKVAREKAIDGGSAPEKSAIFQVYKDQINEYLTAQGHDVAKAFRDFEAQQASAKSPPATNAAQ